MAMEENKFNVMYSAFQFTKQPFIPYLIYQNKSHFSSVEGTIPKSYLDAL